MCAILPEFKSSKRRGCTECEVRHSAPAAPHTDRRQIIAIDSRSSSSNWQTTTLLLLHLTVSQSDQNNSHLCLCCVCVWLCLVIEGKSSECCVCLCAYTQLSGQRQPSQRLAQPIEKKLGRTRAKVKVRGVSGMRARLH